MDKLTYAALLRTARQVSRRADEAEDLLQIVLVAALEADRTDLTQIENRRWLFGALRKRSLFESRTAIRRRLRESRFLASEPPAPESRASDSIECSGNRIPREFIGTLPIALRTTALLVLSGHTRREIAWLLRVSDAALRQRIRELKRRWQHVRDEPLVEFTGLGNTLIYGRMRQSMLGVMGRSSATLASHDPDGHIFVLSSQNRPARQLDSTE